MKNTVLLFFLLILLMAGCGGPDQEKMFGELEGAFSNLGDDKINEAKSRYTHFYRQKIEKALKPAEFSVIDSVHQIASWFYELVDSAESAHHDDGEYPIAELMKAYHSTLDLMIPYAPDIKYRPGEYSQISKEPDARRLFLALLTLEVARSENAILERLHEQYDVGVIKDDFQTAPYTRTLGTSANRVSFTVNFKYLQQFPSREILIDSVLLNNRRVEVPAIIDQDNILAVVNFNSLKKGHYVIKGRALAVTPEGIQGGPFDYRVEVK